MPGVGEKNETRSKGYKTSKNGTGQYEIIRQFQSRLIFPLCDGFGIVVHWVSMKFRYRD
jgi:hypothetical protein